MSFGFFFSYCYINWVFLKIFLDFLGRLNCILHLVGYPLPFFGVINGLFGFVVSRLFFLVVLLRLVALFGLRLFFLFLFFLGLGLGLFLALLNVFVDGIDITKRSNQLEYFREKVGFLFQNFALVENKTVRQNLELVRKKNRSDVSIEQAVEKVGLSDKLDAKVYTLSGGEQQRIALARLMVKKCDLILADEPTGSLDKANAERIMSILKSLNTEQGKTVIMVTHDEELKKQGSRIIEL